MGEGPYADGVIHVMPDKCSTCIFRPGNPMYLKPGRVKSMVDEAVGAGSCIPCHKTIHGQREQQAVCRGFFDAYADSVFALRLGKVLGIIKEVDNG